MDLSELKGTKLLFAIVAFAVVLAVVIRVVLIPPTLPEIEAPTETPEEIETPVEEVVQEPEIIACSANSASFTDSRLRVTEHYLTPEGLIVLGIKNVGTDDVNLVVGDVEIPLASDGETRIPAATVESGKVGDCYNDIPFSVVYRVGGSETTTPGTITGTYAEVPVSEEAVDEEVLETEDEELTETDLAELEDEGI